MAKKKHERAALTDEELAARKARNKERHAQKKARDATELRGVVKLEIVKVLGRYDNPPAAVGCVVRRIPKPLPPFPLDEKGNCQFPKNGDNPYWCPPLQWWSKEKKAFDVIIPRSPTTQFHRICELIQRRCSRIGNLLLRDLWMDRTGGGDGTAINDYKMAVAGMESGEKGWEVPPDVVSKAGVCNSLGRRVRQLFGSVWKRTDGFTIPTLDRRGPITVRADSWRITSVEPPNVAVRIDGTWWELALKLPKRKGGAGRTKSSDIHVMTNLRRLAASEAVHKRETDGRKNMTALGKLAPTKSMYVPGTLDLYRPKTKQNRWFVALSLRKPKPKPISRQEAVVVHLGMKLFVLAMSITDMLRCRPGFWEDTRALFRTRMVFNARRKDVARASKLHRCGRGFRTRRAVDLNHVEGRWINSWLRRIAARIVAKARGIGAIIYLPDLSNIRDQVEIRLARSDIEDDSTKNWLRKALHAMPWYRLSLFIKQVADREGVAWKEYAPRWHTKRCPWCGTIDVAAPDYDKWRYICMPCGRTLPLDRVGVANAFLDLGLVSEAEIRGALDRTVAARTAADADGTRDLLMVTGVLKQPKMKRGKSKPPTTNGAQPT